MFRFAPGREDERERTSERLRENEKGKRKTQQGYLPEKVDQNSIDRPAHRPERRLHVLPHPRVLGRDERQVEADRDHRVQNQRDLAVLVDEREGVRDVVVSQVHDRGADPRAEAGLRGLEELGHGPADARGRLDLGEKRERGRERNARA